MELNLEELLARQGIQVEEKEESKEEKKEEKEVPKDIFSAFLQGKEEKTEPPQGLKEVEIKKPEDILSLISQTKKEVQEKVPIQLPEVKIEKKEPLAQLGVEPPKVEISEKQSSLTELLPKKEEKKQTHVITVQDDEFDFSEEIDLGKEVHLIYGLKGHGKTTVAMSYPGKIAVLSFDRKSTAVKYLFQDRLDEIKVWNAVKYMDYSSPEAELVSADRNFRYLIRLLDEVVRKWEPDWVIIDGSEILSHICELVMRYRNGLMPFQGIANLNLWKERRMYLRQIHYLALDVAKRGVIYTTYVDKEEIIEDGEVKTKRDIPKWLDILVYETDVVIRVWSTIDKGSGLRFYAIVESSKVPYIKTGIQADITNKLAFDEIVRLSKIQKRGRLG